MTHTGEVLTNRSISERDNIKVAMLVLPWSSRYNSSVVSSLSRCLCGYVKSSVVGGNADTLTDTQHGTTAPN